MRPWLVILILLLGTLPALLAQPGNAPAPFMQPSALVLAARDIAAVSPAYQQHCRYLWMPPSVPDAELSRLVRVLSGLVNGLSREPDLVPLAVVPGSQGRLLRLSLLDYRLKAATWDKFARTDPYWYTLVDEDYPAGTDSAGNKYAAGTWQVPALAPWAYEVIENKPHAIALLAATKAKAPIVTASVFAFQTLVSTNGTPNYNDFLGVKTEQDFFKLLGVREDEDEAFSKNLLALIATSGITYEPRAIEMREKVGGWLWRTHDFVKATDKQNPFENLGSDAKTKKLRAAADAHENYGHLSNGLWAVGLFNGAGVAQANAPDTITTGDDSTTDARDHRVHLPLSCVRCHSSGGLQDLDDWVRNLQRPPPSPPLSLQIGNKADPKDVDAAVTEALRFRRQYGIRLEPHLAGSRQRYETALAEVTGLTGTQYARAVGETWQLLCEPKIDSAWAARDLGMSEAAFVTALDKQVKLAGGTDVLLSGFLKPAGKGQRTIQLRQWLELYPRAIKATRGIVDVQKVKP